MNLASIDIGTNAVLLLILKKEETGLKELFDASTITRLGEGLLRHRTLSAPAMERTVRAIEKYREIIDSYGAWPVCCFGTSALREAENREQFIRMVRESAGIEVRTISEHEEAYYTYLSVIRDRRIAGENLAVVDIGGGSTEIAMGSRREMKDYISLPIGTVKLTEFFIRNDPPQVEELSTLSKFIRGKIPPWEGANAPTVIGMGGTVTTFAAMVLGLEAFDKNRIHGLEVSLQALDLWVDRLGRMSVEERKAIPGMEPGREDLLLPGIVLMKGIVSSFRVNRFTVSTYGARYGVLYEATEKC